MSSDIFRLMYASKAAEDICYSDLQAILQVSRTQNLEREITGILIFRDGLFLQLLEGKKTQVKEVLGKIVQDSRHSHLKVLCESSADRRLFKNWPMAYMDGDIDEENQDVLQTVFSDVFLSQAADAKNLIEELVKISKEPKYLVQL